MDTNDSTRFADLKARVEALGCKLVDNRNGDAVILDPATGKLQMAMAEIDAWCSSRQAAARWVPAEASAWLAGADIAIDLLEEGAEIGLDEMALQDDCRAGRPQSNVFLKHLQRLRALNDPTSDIAFSAVMTEYVGLYAAGLTMKAIIDESRKPIATTAEGGAA